MLFACLKSDNSSDEAFKFYHWTFKSPYGVYEKLQKLIKKRTMKI